jgi:predicted RND superfamily exporter protein
MILIRIARFWYEFIVGDDWLVAAAVVIALVVVNLLVRMHVPAWWLLPLVVIGVLGTSVWRGSRS